MDKIIFFLPIDQDGFPPISVELINATQIKEGVFKLDNTPFFTSDISFNDIVTASPTEHINQFEFIEVIEQSSFVALSIIIMDKSMDSFLMDFFRGLDCVIEYGEFGVYRVLAVAVPKSVDYGSVRESLQSLENQELISFSELALPP